MTDITEQVLGQPSAVALGFFDGLHLGHIEVVKRTLLRPELKSVIFTFNEKTALPKFKQSKGRCIITHEQKKRLLEKIGVDYIFAPDFSDIKNLSAREFAAEILKKRLCAEYVVCGYDFRFGKGGEGDPEMLRALCRELGMECEIVEPVRVDGEIVSSTEIRRLIRNGEITRANRLLGYELSYCLPVIHGSKIGRTIGFPTINQKIPDYMVQPKNGVYKSWALVGGKTYRAITNIGVKPTVGYTGEALMETHIIGFSGDLYGECVSVSLREFLRGEQRFESLDALKRQLSYDKSIF